MTHVDFARHHVGSGTPSRFLVTSALWHQHLLRTRWLARRRARITGEDQPAGTRSPPVFNVPDNSRRTAHMEIESYRSP